MFINRSPWCSSTTDSIEYNFINPQSSHYNKLVVWLQKDDGSRLSRDVNGTSNVLFTQLESGAGYQIYTVTHAGQDNLLNNEESEKLLCHTLPIIAPMLSDDSMSMAISNVDIMLIVALVLAFISIMWLSIYFIKYKNKNGKDNIDENIEQDDNLLNEQRTNIIDSVTKLRINEVD